MQFSRLSKILTYKKYHLINDVLITDLSIDSRSNENSKNAIFFAIRSSKRDGHDFIEDAFNKGIRNFVLEEHGYKVFLEDANYCIVDDSVKALQEIALNHKQQFNLDIIAITGSNGKTIVKEWLSEILSSKYACVKSPKSFNSQIGVPLSVWQIKNYHQIGVFEAGISTCGEMNNLYNILKPKFGILTNIGSAHDSGFSSKKEKLFEKLLLFQNSDVLIVRENELNEVLEYKDSLKITRIVSWGEKKNNDYHVKIHTQNRKAIADINGFEYFLPFSDQASVENLCHSIICATILGVDPVSIQKSISQLASIAMRLEVKDAESDCLIIDDSYNHDLAGLKVALEYLLSQYPNYKKSVILSEFSQSGLSASAQVDLFSNLLSELNLTRIILIGQDFDKLQNNFPDLFQVFESAEDFLRQKSSFEFNKEVILIKGARHYAFEKIVKAFEKQIHGTKLEINLSKLAHNLNYFKSLLNPKTKLMVMVKAFAYGSGTREITNLLQFSKVDYLGVAYASEGVELRKFGLSLPIFVMNASPESLGDCFAHNLEPEIFSLRSAKEFVKELSKQKRTISVHINIDTGMRRLGFEISELEELSEIINENNIKVASIFSHLSSSDDVNERSFTLEQIKLFEHAFDILSKNINQHPLKHILNTAGIVNYPEYQFDLVRLGIGLYGIENTVFPDNPLEPIGRLTSEVSQIRNVDADQPIGYSKKGKLLKSGRIATIPIGYADGYSRAFGNGAGKVWINGSLAPVVGNVCMDMIMVDVSEIEVNEGDAVVIFGPELPVTSMAKWANTIPYEILTNISERVKRVFTSD